MQSRLHLTARIKGFAFLAISAFWDRLWSAIRWFAEWLADKIFGDAVYKRLSYAAETLMSDSWWPIVLDWGPRLVLIIFGFYLLIRPIRRSKAVKKFKYKIENNFLSVIGGHDFVFDCKSGTTFVFLASGDVKLHRPISPKEGIYDIIIVHGDNEGYLGFSDDFKFGKGRLLAPIKRSKCIIYLRIIIMLEKEHFIFLINLLGNNVPLANIAHETALTLTKNLPRL